MWRKHVQIGTELHKKGRKFSRIIKELTQIMSEKDIRQLTNLKANYAPFHSKETKVMIDLRLFYKKHSSVHSCASVLIVC